MNDMGEVKTKHRKLTIIDILYDDTLWIVFYIFNTLYAFGRVMVRYNYSSVADSNPISVALHGGFYLICAMVVGGQCMGARFARCSVMEMLYFENNSPLPAVFGDLFLPAGSTGYLYSGWGIYGGYSV